MRGIRDGACGKARRNSRDSWKRISWRGSSWSFAIWVRSVWILAAWPRSNWFLAASSCVRSWFGSWEVDDIGAR